VYKALLAGTVVVGVRIPRRASRRATGFSIKLPFRVPFFTFSLVFNMMSPTEYHYENTPHLASQDFSDATTPYSSTSSSGSLKSTLTYVNPFDFGNPRVNELVKKLDCQHISSIPEKKAREAVSKSLKTLTKSSYVIEALVGYGANGAVISALNQNGERVAIKLIYKTARRSSQPVRSTKPTEVTLLSELSHPNILGFLDSFEDEFAYFLVTEYLGAHKIQASEYMSIPVVGGQDVVVAIAITTSDLEAQVETLDAQETIYQIAAGLADMHDNGTTHGDIKMANCIVSEGTVKICDFGFASQSYRAFYGSQGYAAPELLVPVVKGRPSGREADVWAAGLCLLQMLGGEIRHKEFQQAIMIGQVCDQYPGVESFLGLGGDLLRGMLCVDPESRLTASQVLEHEWFKLTN
jgi:serine/threonine protein kinase